MTELYTNADVLVLPYRRGSSSGPFHIAMSHGIPVILYDVPALREAAERYEGARFVPANDIRALRAEICRLSREPTRRYEATASWDESRAGYERLIGQSPEAPERRR